MATYGRRFGPDAARVYARSRAHAQGSIDLSGATTLMNTFQDFCPLCRRRDLPRRLIFAGIRLMGGRFQDAIPGLFGALFGAGVLGWGAGWISSLTGQSIITRRRRIKHDTTRRTITDQSGDEPIQSQTRPGAVDMDGHCLCLDNGFPRWFSPLAVLSFPMLVGCAWLTVRKHPKMFQLWGRSLGQKATTTPAKNREPYVQQSRTAKAHTSGSRKLVRPAASCPSRASLARPSSR